MGDRSVVSLAVVAVALAVVVATVPLGSQSRSAAGTAAAGPAPKTPWGHPDLQGIWTYEEQIPFERPAEYANKEFFTEEEMAALDKKRSSLQSRNYRAERGSEADVAGAYNAVFLTMKRTGRRTSLVVDPPNGRVPETTAAFKKQAAAQRAFALELLAPTDTCRQEMRGCAGGKYGPVSSRRNDVPPYYLTGAINRNNGPEDRSMGERCMAGSLPEFGTAFGGSYRRIVQSPNLVAIAHDQGQGQGWHRMVPVDGSSHPPAHVRLLRGDSRGRWEGNSLVIDVSNFSPKSDFRGSRENLHLVERWTRVDARTLEYQVTIEDPTVWTRPYTVKQEFILQDGQANRIYYEPRCHEGNYSMAAMLQGTRLEEEAFAKGQGPDPATRCTAGCTFGPDEETQDPLQ